MLAGLMLVQGLLRQQPHRIRSYHHIFQGLLQHETVGSSQPPLATFVTRRRIHSVLNADRSVKAAAVSSSTTTTSSHRKRKRRRRRMFDDYLPRLQEYYQRHGHTNVTLSSPENEDLYDWADSIRKRQRQLSNEQKQALDDVQFVWTDPAAAVASPPRRGRPRTKPHRRLWDDYFPKLEAFYQTYGHCNVTAEQDKDLYKWASSLRKNYQCQAIVRNVAPSLASSVSMLSDEQVDALHDMDFSWSSLSTTTTELSEGVTRWKTWDDYFPRLLRFYESHGHCNVTTTSQEDGDVFDKDLAQWVDSLKHRKLSKDKREVLQKMGVPLEVEQTRTSQHRREMIDRLHSFYKEYSHILVKEIDDPDLFRWTRMCLRNYGHAYLMRLVDPSYGHKSRRDEKWETMLQQLKEYSLTHGHCRVSSTDGQPKLYKFVQNQRQQYRKLVRGESSLLTGRRVELLEELGFDWGKSHDIRWRERLQELDAFQNIYGHAKVPQQFRLNPQLGRWVMNQRTLKRLNGEGMDTSLRQPRISQLEEAAFVWKAHDDQWWDMFGKVKAYEQEYGNLTTIATGDDGSRESMRQWLNEQRYHYRSDSLRHRMTQHRVEALESLPSFQWVYRQRTDSPSKADWSELMNAMREKGITPQAKVKTHWFDGVNPFQEEVKTVWTDEELMALWNEEIEEDKDDDDYYYEDEDSKNFLRA